MRMLNKIPVIADVGWQQRHCRRRRRQLVTMLERAHLAQSGGEGTREQGHGGMPGIKNKKQTSNTWKLHFMGDILIWVWVNIGPNTKHHVCAVDNVHNLCMLFSCLYSLVKCRAFFTIF
ncbi:hypothetical protein I3843_10G012200 [Carya illinoinensis]|nr:hypothetical protein I3843_10G012200 [Carya illinoinensis]